MSTSRVTCPVCRVSLPPDSTICPDCGEDLATLVHLHRKSAILYNSGLGSALTGDLARAIRMLEESIEVDGRPVDALCLLGKLYARQDRLADARAVWERGVSIDPEHAETKACLARLGQVEANRDDQARWQQERQAEQIAIEKRRESRARLRHTAVGVASGVAAGVIAALLWQVTGVGIASPSVPATTIGSALASPSPAVVASAPTQVLETPTTILTRATESQPTATSAGQSSVSHVSSPTPTASSVKPMVSSPTATPLPDLRQPVKAALGSDPDLVTITVQQDGSTIRLLGSVPSLLARYRAEQKAKSVDGVGIVDLQSLQVAQLHRVRRGDTLWEVSIQVYGSPDRWQSIAEANHLVDPDSIKEGQTLVIPLP